MRNILTYALVFAWICLTSASVCDVPSTHRENCGYSGISQYSCETFYDCCYNSSIENSCYQKARTASVCDVPSTHRENCGYSGISQYSCETFYECCYNSSISYSCFKKARSALVLNITPDNEGYLGSNGTTLTCNSITIQENNITLFSFVANGNKIIEFIINKPPKLTDNGQYLEGRVILGNMVETNINSTHVKYEASVTFTDLQCVDDNNYTCNINYIDAYYYNSFTSKTSSVSKLFVRVLPIHPKELTIIKYNATEPENATDINYLSELAFVEGDTVRATCGGDVGKPPAILTMQMILSNGSSFNLLPDNNPVNVEMPNCSFYQINSFTAILTEENNRAKLRCAVGDSKSIFIESTQIMVLFPVRTPVISSYQSYPNKTPLLMLHCYGRGNPEPEYAWFKLSQTTGYIFYVSTQNITLNSITDSGLYRCNVTNRIGDNIYRESSSIAVTLQDNPNYDDACACDERSYVVGILGGVFGTLAFCVVVSAIVCLWQKRSKKKFDQRPQITTIADQSYEGIGAERTEHCYTELRQRNEEPYYNTPI